jgi:predicted aconitase with swiveling domain
VQNSTIVGKAEPFGTESSQAFSFRGEVDSASGAVLLDVRDEGHFDGKINGRRMSVKGWTGLANCQFTLDQVSPS